MKNKKRFKTMYVYIGILIVLFAALTIINRMGPVSDLYNKPVSELNKETRKQLKDPNYQNIILPEELDQKIADKETFYLYVFASDCHFCKETTPDLLKLANELNVDLPMYNLREFVQHITSNYNIRTTPTLVYYENGQEVARLERGLQTENTPAGYPLDVFRNFFTDPHAAATTVQ